MSPDANEIYDEQVSQIEDPAQRFAVAVTGQMRDIATEIQNMGKLLSGCKEGNAAIMAEVETIHIKVADMNKTVCKLDESYKTRRAVLRFLQRHSGKIITMLAALGGSLATIKLGLIAAIKAMIKSGS